ncbi:MAG: signal peptidase I [Coprothermobacterota bacterium]|nr:signal peptidase I [Coprothermobacterota bacterium]
MKLIPTRSRAFVREALGWLSTLFIAGVLTFLVSTFLVGSNEVFSCSMQPTLVEGNRILVSHLAYTLGTPRRGEIVVFDPPVTPASPTPYVKRVIGLAGEQLDIANGKVCINGQELLEPYVKGETRAIRWVHLLIPPGTVFLMGDNRENSYDSRSFGPVPISSLQGRAVLRYWPLDSPQPF